MGSCSSKAAYDDENDGKAVARRAETKETGGQRLGGTAVGDDARASAALAAEVCMQLALVPDDDRNGPLQRSQRVR